ncbi:hypothetical protein KAR91_06695 [Candidatus Pacearchaeota archaeon]|nr:hypothetical protein [Candidatus Pacearchaeota archaeon]
MKFDDFKTLWNKTPAKGFYCIGDGMFFHRSPNNELNLKRLNDFGFTLEGCFKCGENIINGGDCDPI